MDRSLAQLILPIKMERSSHRPASLGGLVVQEELARGVRLWEEVDRVLEGPFLGYVNGVCVGYQFREGNQSTGAGILEFAQGCQAALPQGRRIYFRSDSAAYQAAMINHYMHYELIL